MQSWKSWFPEARTVDDAGDRPPAGVDRRRRSRRAPTSPGRRPPTPGSGSRSGFHVGVGSRSSHAKRPGSRRRSAGPCRMGRSSAGPDGVSSSGRYSRPAARGRRPSRSRRRARSACQPSLGGSPGAAATTGGRGLHARSSCRRRIRRAVHGIRVGVDPDASHLRAFEVAELGGVVGTLDRSRSRDAEPDPITGGTTIEVGQSRRRAGRLPGVEWLPGSSWGCQGRHGSERSRSSARWDARSQPWPIGVWGSTAPCSTTSSPSGSNTRSTRKRSASVVWRRRGASRRPDL